MRGAAPIRLRAAGLEGGIALPGAGRFRDAPSPGAALGAGRREIYVEMQRIVSIDGGSVIPIFLAYTHAGRNNVGLPDKIANNRELDGHKNGERWWFTG